MTSTLLHSARILTVDGDDTAFAQGWISFADGVVTGLGAMDICPDPSGFDAAKDMTGHLVMPGLINAHTHAPMILFRGHAEGHSLLTMDGWYNAIREPELAMEARDVGPAVALSCAEMLLSGTTTYCEQYFFAEEIAEAVAASGMRGVLAYGIVELGDRARGIAELEKAVAFVEGQRRAGGRIIPWFGPHAPYVDNSAALISDEVAAAKRLGCGLHLHMAAGPEDNEMTMAERGLTAAQALEQDGFFEGRVHAAHCLCLSDEDIAVFARAPMASVVQCASAGMRSGRGMICPAVDLKAAGVTVALGTDNVAANNGYDMVIEMRMAGQVASHREGRAQPIPASELVRMATIEGAKALGIDAVTGSLEIGKAADITVFDTSGPGWSESPDIAAALVYSGSGRDVTHVWVEGEPLVADGALLRQDFAAIRQTYTSAYTDFWSRVARAREVA